MGTSRLSSNIYSIYKSLIYQFRKIFNKTDKLKDLKDSIEARDYLFNELLINNETSIKHDKIIILLDALDRLDECDHDLTWMLYDLPKNIKLIFTTLDKHANILQIIKQTSRLKNKNYMGIMHLEIIQAVNQLKKLFEVEKRDLQTKQWHVINKCLTKTGKIYSFHIKLLFDITFRWVSSYQPHLNSLDECISIKETTKFLFKQYELIFDRVIFKHFVFYLTIFKHGIGASEIEDILSLDEIVLSQVFSKHEPVIRRFPSSILNRIIYELRNYLNISQYDNTVIMSWYHRAFNEAAKEYYEELFKPSTQRDQLLQNVIDYFNEEWKNKPKNYVSAFNGENKSVARYTKSQKMKQTSKKTGEIVFNRRKLNEFVDLVFLINDIKLKISCLIDYVYCNYEFLHTQSMVNPEDGLKFLLEKHENILKTFEEVKKSKDDDELLKKAELLLDISSIYVNNYEKIRNYPDSLLYEVCSKAKDNNAEIILKSVNKNEHAIIPLQLGFNSNHEQILYADNNESIESIVVYWCYNTPYVLLECRYKNSLNVIKIINNVNGMKINGQINIGTTYCYNLNPIIPFMITKPKDKYTNIKQFDGGVVYRSKYNHELNQHNIYVKCFVNGGGNTVYPLKTCESQVIDMFLISCTSLLVHYSHSFEIINFNDYEIPIKLFESEISNETILRMQSTMIKYYESFEVFVPEYDQIDYTIICALYKNKVQIYKYDKINGKIIGDTHLIQIKFDYEIYRDETPCYYFDRYYSIESILMEKQNINELSNASSTQVISIVSLDGDIADNWSVSINNKLKITVTNVFSDNKKKLRYQKIDLSKNDKCLFDEIKGSKYLKIHGFYNKKLIFGLLDSGEAGCFAQMIWIYDISEYKTRLSRTYLKY